MLPSLAPLQSGLPGLELSALLGLAAQFLFAMLRVGAFVVAAPLFAARFVPLPVRIVIAVALAVPVMGQVALPAPETLASLQALPMVLRELAIGLSAGLVLQILFAAALIAGDRIANTAGLGLAAQVDPSTGAQSPVIGQFFFLFLLSIFVALDGHLQAIALVLKSYQLVPPGHMAPMQLLADVGLQAAAEMFADGARLMMPVVTVLLLLNMVIGVITRSAPQLNIFAFGFPLTMAVTILLLFATVSSLAPALAHSVAQALQVLENLFAGLANGTR